jgi:hypothetical protein
VLYHNAQGTYMLERDEASQRSAPAAREARPLHALLGGGIVDESPIYALLTNSDGIQLIFMLKRSIS